MKNESSKNVIIILLIMIIIILVIFAILLATNTINFNSSNTNVESNNKEDVSNIEQEEQESNENIDQDKNKISIEDLYGTYNWQKSYINDYGNELNLKIKLVLNSDGSATYDSSSGYEYEATKGTFVYEDGKIIYTKEYYNYNGENGQDTDERYSDENSKIETFIIVDKNTLQNTYYEQTTALKK